MRVAFGRWQRPIPLDALAPAFGRGEGYIYFELPLNAGGRTLFCYDEDHTQENWPDTEFNELVEYTINGHLDHSVKTAFASFEFDRVTVEFNDNHIEVQNIYNFLKLKPCYYEAVVRMFDQYMTDIYSKITEILEDEQISIPEGNVVFKGIEYEKDENKEVIGEYLAYGLEINEGEPEKEPVWYNLQAGRPYYTEQTYNAFKKFGVPVKDNSSEG